MILVTGATGTVGGAVARSLAGQGSPVRLLARDPRRVEVRGAGDDGSGVDTAVEIVSADYADPRGLEAAFRGITHAFVATNNPLRPEHDTNLLAAAQQAGVQRLVRLSALAVQDPEASDLITDWHRDCEQAVAASGLAWTFVRPRAFMSNWLMWADSVRAGVVRTPFGHARSAFVDPRDVAEVAVRALTESGHEGQAHPVTGPVAISAFEQTGQLGELLGRKLIFEEITLEQACAFHAKRYPLPIAEAITECTRRLATGAKSGVELTVEKLTGRPARTFRQWARDHIAAFR